VKLSVIIPLYNEKTTIFQVIKKIRVLPLETEIIIVDDFSTDGTRDAIKKLEHDADIKILYHEKNKGKGAAIRTAIRHMTGDIVIIQDADLEYDPNDYVELVKPIVEGTTSVVYGSRQLGLSNKHSYVSFYLGGRLLTILTNLLYGSTITDEPTCYKVFKAETLKSIPLKCERFEFCPEVTAKVLKRKLRIVELPIHYYPRKKEEGKKIRWKDGVEAIWTLLKYRIIG
jgi:dolichol-phosphate mannosyltransferase